MKLFLKNIFLFLILPFLVLVLVFFSDYDREFAWNLIEGDCGGHGNWMYNRIYNNPNPIDVAFLGSSGIISGIDEKIVEDSFRNTNRLDWHFANLGYCRFGRNLDYVILKELLKKRKVKYVILEVRHDESRASHPMFPYLATREDVLKPAVLFNRKIISDWYLAMVSRIEHWKQKVFYEKKEYAVDDNPHGHYSINSVEEPAILEESKAKKIKKYSKKGWPVIRKLEMRYPRYYLDRIAELCKANGTELLFLHIPSYGLIDLLPKELDTYRQYGKVFIPPSDIFNDKKHWSDEAHVNTTGGKLCSQWFISAFSSYIEGK